MVGHAALARAGLERKILESAVRMPGRMIHTGDDSIFQPYSRDPERAINSVSRSGLNFDLLEAADALPNACACGTKNAVALGGRTD